MIQTKSKEELPYEKCLEQGAEALSSKELLAVLLRTGTKGLNVLELAEHILSPECGDSGILNIHNCTLEKLKNIPLFIATGEDDLVVKVATNINLLEAELKRYDIAYTIIRRPAWGHHPHGFDNRTELIKFHENAVQTK